jgi:ribonucleotide reductase alpha subunit
MSAYERPQPHACFIQGVEDDLVNDNGIMDLWVREARLFKYGSGTGSNFSKLRGSGESLSGGGQSSGLMSFLKVGDRAAGSIKSGGTTRRAAKMVVVDIDHPDIESFISWKMVEEQKVAALVAGSKLCEKHLNHVMSACHEGDRHDDERFNPRKNSRVQFHGRYPPSEVGHILSKLDVLVVPSRWYENAPLTIQEAFLSGIPVVASRLGGMAEFVHDEENGLLFNVGDPADLARCLRRLHDDRDLLRRLRPTVKTHKSIESDAHTMELRYRELIAARASMKAAAHKDEQEA